MFLQDDYVRSWDDTQGSDESKFGTQLLHFYFANVSGVCQMHTIKSVYFKITTVVAIGIVWKNCVGRIYFGKGLTDQLYLKLRTANQTAPSLAPYT